MDVTYFLKERTDFIRFYYDTSATTFSGIKNSIENELPPFDNPEYSEDGEPSFLEDWRDANTAIEILGLSCISLLSDSMKIYFKTLQNLVIGFTIKNEKELFKNGFVDAYLKVLGHILQTDWQDSNVNFAVIEQIVLARNRGQHTNDLTSFTVPHDNKMIQKHPNPFFAKEEELIGWSYDENSMSSLFLPSIDITREKLFSAIDEVEKLADFIESRASKAWEWRMRNK